MKDIERYSPPTSASPWLIGGGEMGKLVSAMDWSETPLGPIESWPQSLRTTVNLALASSFPIIIVWGPRRVQIYNDGFWPICGAKHPSAMGQDFKQCWRSAWPVIGTAFESAASGETAFLENQRVFLDRNGYLEETFFTFSFSPIRDDAGKVAGLFHPLTEMTAQSLAERRLGVLRDIADDAGVAHSIGEAATLTLKTLARHQLDVPFAVLYFVDHEGTEARLAGAANMTAGKAPCLDQIPFLPGHADQVHWPLDEVMRTESMVDVNELEARFGVIASGPYPESPRRAVMLPIKVAGVSHPLAILVAGVSPRRPLDAAYRTFFAMLQAAVTNVLVAARAYEDERKRLLALTELDQAKTAFFGNVSHEFRTPLTLMLGPIEEALSGRSELPPGLRMQLDMAHRNAQRLLKLVNSLLDFSRIEAGRAQASYRATDLAALTADLASNFRSVCEQAGLELEVHCPPLPVPVYVDRDMWEKIVLNLISNAFKFTLQGRIEVSMRAREGMALLQVADTGVGVPAQDLPRLFERFHRVEGTRGRTIEGTGIGLALVQELVGLHGGAIDVQSEIEQGTTFTLAIPFGSAHLPSGHIDGAPTFRSTAAGAGPYVEEALSWLRHEQHGSRPAAPADVERQSPPQHKHTAATRARARILLADDNADMRAYVVRLLSTNFDVETAEHGESALHMAQQSPPDLVLSDIMMPRLDGIGLLRALRADQRTCGIPVILLSARAGDEPRVGGIEAGADDYLVKPFGARELLARVETHLRLAQMRRRTEERLRAADRRKDEFLAVLGHELRNPLAALTNALEVAQSRSDPVLSRRCFDILERQAAALVRLVEDLLDIPRVLHGNLRLTCARLDMMELLRNAVEGVSSLFRARGHELVMVLPEPGPMVFGDAVRLNQVFANLLDNAAKYTPNGGRIEVAAQSDDAELRVHVRDNGVGIPADEREYIFEMFHQVGEPPDARARGLGVGLSLVKSLVELHGGRIEVVSPGEGAGSEFTITLPLAKDVAV